MHIQTPPQRKIGFATSKKEVLQYKNAILEQFQKHNIIEQAQKLHDDANPNMEDNIDFVNKLNAVDSDITRIVKEATI